jgi:hypothetical protein
MNTRLRPIRVIVNLVMARATAKIRLLFGLVRVEVAAAVRRHAVDPAPVFLIQKETGAILASDKLGLGRVLEY